MKDLLKHLIDYRNELHQIPELGFEEYKTSSYIKSELTKMGLAFEEVLGTGVLVYLKGQDAKQTLAFRADIDGLPVLEATGKVCPSGHVGKMHACGHDGHMSMLLGFAKYLSDKQMQLNDNIVLIFQPAEEGPGGAKELVELGIFEKYAIDKIYGIHLMPDVEQGKFGVCKGPAMAMVGEVDIDIITESAHGAMPHMGKDAVLIASECVMGLQSIVSRNINPIKPAVLTVGVFQSGTRRNILSGKTRLEATVRAFDKESFDLILSRIDTYLRGMEAAYEVNINIEKRVLYPPVINDEGLFDHFVSLNEGKIEIMAPQMISEDFAYYQECVPGLFYFLGTKNEEKNYIFPLHNDRFDFDDAVLLDGVQSYIELLKSMGSLNIE